MASPFIKINGTDMPAPKVYSTVEGQQLVNAARNAAGTTIGEIINRRITKFNLVWPYLTYTQWRVIKLAVEDLYADVTYWDIIIDDVITRRFYFGNDSAIMHAFDAETYDVMKPTVYRDCAVNIIDVGEVE
jgi:hypothetical protein